MWSGSGYNWVDSIFPVPPIEWNHKTWTEHISSPFCKEQKSCLRRIPGTKVFLNWQGVYLPLSCCIFPLPLSDTSNLDLIQPEIQNCVLSQRKNSRKSTLAVAQGSNKEMPYLQREYRNLSPFYLSLIFLLTPQLPKLSWAGGSSGNLQEPERRKLLV